MFVPFKLYYTTLLHFSSSSSSGILLFTACRSMTPITWQAAINNEEQRPLLQDIFEAAVDGHHVLGK